jgi:hypothetical protein
VSKADFKPNEKKLKEAQSAIILAKGNVAAAARTCKVSEKTFHRYIKAGYIDKTISVDGENQLEAIEKLAADRNAKLADSMVGTAEKAVEQVNAELYTASAKDAAIIAGVMIDKSRLIEGKATQRVDIGAAGSLFDLLERHGLLQDSTAEEVIEAEVVGEIAAGD